MNQNSDKEVIGRNPYEIKEGLAFCIELTPSILEEDPVLQHSQLEEILISLLETMASLVISLPNTGVGCYIFNVDGVKDGLLKLFELKDLNATDTKLINDILDDHRSGRVPLREKFPLSETRSNLFLVFSLIQDDFLFSKTKSSNKPYNNKKLFLFTDNDKPYDGNYQLQLSLRKLFSDFQDSYINVVPFLTDKIDGTKFDKTEYDNILFQNLDVEQLDKPIVTTMTSDKIRSKINRVKEVKRVQFTCPLEIAPELKISIKGYSIFTHEKLSSSSKVVSESDRYLIVNGSNVILDEITGDEIDPQNNVKAYKLGQDLLPLTLSQLLKIKQYGELQKPLLRVIGFRGMSHYLRQYNMGKSIFITADNNGDYTHSHRSLSCLYQALTNKRKYAVVWGFNRTNSSPGLFAMIPSSMIKSSLPEGFFLSRLPFRDDIRQIPSTVNAQLEPQLEIVKNYSSILKRFYMKNGYVPQEYENPSIQWHYKIIRDELCQVEINPASLTSENEISQLIFNEYDTTKRKIGNVRDAILMSMEENKELNHEPELIQNKSVSELIKNLNSRLNKLSNDVTRVDNLKKIKTEPELQDKEVLQNYQADTLNSFKVQQLRKYMKKRNIYHQGNSKAELINGLKDFLSTKQIKGDLNQS